VFSCLLRDVVPHDRSFKSKQDMIPFLCPRLLGLSGSENLQRISCVGPGGSASAVRILANIYMHQAYGSPTLSVLLAEPPCNCV